jgi:hypothetical protein
MNNGDSRMKYIRFYLDFKHTCLCLLAGLFLSLNASANTCTSTGNGSWDDASTWSCGQVPGCGDTIVIAANQTVQINHGQVDLSACSPSNYVRVNGTLKFANGFKLRLNCGSIVQVMSGGHIMAGNGNGNNNLIEICGNIVWNAACGDLAGPLSMPSYDCVLPITLSSFTAEKYKGDDVIIRWTTSSEINNDYFVIEKSANGKDFSELSTVDGAGNSTSNLYYNVTDDRPFNPVSYYRLKQVDYDGTTTYSNIVAVRMSGKDFESLTMQSDYDNGAIRATLVGSYKGKAQYHLSDILGNDILSGTVQTIDGINEIKLDASALARSVYYFSIRNENDVLTKKIFY